MIIIILYEIPYFFNQTPWLLFFLLFDLVRLLFEGSVYFIGKPGGKIKYMQAIHAGSSTTASQWKRVLGHKQP